MPKRLTKGGRIGIRYQEYIPAVHESTTTKDIAWGSIHPILMTYIPS